MTQADQDQVDHLNSLVHKDLEKRAGGNVITDTQIEEWWGMLQHPYGMDRPAEDDEFRLLIESVVTLKAQRILLLKQRDRADSLLQMMTDALASLCEKAANEAERVGNRWSPDPFLQGYQSGKSRQSALFQIILSALTNTLILRRSNSK